MGAITVYHKVKRGLNFTLEHGIGQIRVFSPKMVRIRISPQKHFSKDHSYAVIKPLSNWKNSPFKFQEMPVKGEKLKEKLSTDIIVKQKRRVLLLKTEKLHIFIHENPFRILIQEPNKKKFLFENEEDGLGACYTRDGKIKTFNKIRPGDHYYGFGEKTGHLDKVGARMEMHNADMPYRKSADPLYQTHPFFLTINKGIAHGIFFDNISKSIFDMGYSHDRYYYFGAEKGELNYYFIHGPTIQEILESYTELTGKMPMPPKWALGFHQCRYSYKNEKQIRKITSKFRKNHVPCDGIWFDIHYMDGYRVFSFDEERFPNPEGLLEEIKEDGFHPIVIVDPGVKVDPQWEIDQELLGKGLFTKRKDGTPSMGYVWPGKTHFPDFTLKKTRTWWAHKHEFYFKKGVEGIWNDMNEPALSINPLRSRKLDIYNMYLDDQGKHTHIEQSRNIYALCEAQATYEAFKKWTPGERPFILTRAGYSGIQRFSATWTGDNWSNWHNINLATRMCLNLSLSAQPFVGEDIGGHMSLGKLLLRLRPKKMFIRWIQAGVFRPFCRVHTTKWTPPQDPFAYGEKAQNIIKKYIELRYSLLPYWYVHFHKAHKTGAPIIKPLFYFDQADEMAHDQEFENEFFVGDDLLIIPIGEKRISEKKIYLPKGTWVDFWTSEEFEGKNTFHYPLTLQDIPIFVRKGSIIPMQPVVEYVDQKPIKNLILRIYAGSPGSEKIQYIYEDDGKSMDYTEGNCIKFKIRAKYGIDGSDHGVSLEFSEFQGDYNPPWKRLILKLYKRGGFVAENVIDMPVSQQEIML